MHVLSIVIAALCGIILAFCIGGAYRTWKVKRMPQQAEFSKGKMPSPLPDGFHAGTVDAYAGSWKGKTFDLQTYRGINVFQRGKKTAETYPFCMTAGMGLQDPRLDVLKIDYDIPGNPFWARRILDEIVEVAPGGYLGKVHLRVIPGFPFTMGYFRLKKAAIA